jgi:hypothetical protein
LSLNDTTIKRRSTTVKKWIEWVWTKIDSIE